MSSGGITREWLEELRNRNDIVAVISRYTPLEKRGRQYWGRCPFHHEKTPSFAVDPARQFYHCFGCGESGDVIKFVEKTESVDFMGAVRILAESAQMTVPAFERNEIDDGLKARRDEMLAIHLASARFYYETLLSEEGAAARDYLVRRGLSKEIATRFGIGLSPGYPQLPRHLEEAGFDLDIAVECGVLGKKDDGAKPYYYDAFGGRLMFPILDSMNNVIAFGGRILEKDSAAAKYRNTSATPIFDKSKNIYGINLVKKLRLKKPVESLILCEGYMDVVALHQAGFQTAVASMGTALTAEQCRLLKRFAGTVYISYDGDAAGQKGMMRGLELLAQEVATVKVITLPEGKDPDELIRERGREAYAEHIEHAQPYFEYKLNMLAKDYELSNNDGRTRFATLAAAEISKLENHLEQEVYVRQVHAMTGFSEESVARQVKAPVIDGVRQTVIGGRSLTATEKAVRFLLYCTLNGFSFVDPAFPLDKHLIDDDAKEILAVFLKRPGLKIAECYAVLDESLHSAVTQMIDENQGCAAENCEAYYLDCLKAVQRKDLEEKVASLSLLYDNTPEREARTMLLQELLPLQEELKTLKSAQV